MSGEYRIHCAGLGSDLAEMVRASVAEGFQPTGGPFVWGDDAGQPGLCQAIWRPARDEVRVAVDLAAPGSDKTVRYPFWGATVGEMRDAQARSEQNKQWSKACAIAARELGIYVTTPESPANIGAWLSVITNWHRQTEPATLGVSLPPIGAPFQGGVFGGVILDDKRQPQCLIWAPNDLPGKHKWNDLLAAARAYKSGDHTWHVPSQRQLMSAYANGIQGFAPDWYWSSTQSSAHHAWVQHFEYGNAGIYGKDHETRCRLVRSVPLQDFKPSTLSEPEPPPVAAKPAPYIGQPVVVVCAPMMDAVPGLVTELPNPDSLNINQAVGVLAFVPMNATARVAYMLVQWLPAKPREFLEAYCYPARSAET